MRALAVIVALLAFPAVEAILYEGTDQWLGRAMTIVVVAIVAVLVSLLYRLPRGTGFTVGWVAMLFLAIIGLVLPIWAYLEVRPVVESLFEAEVGIGPGFWLNAIGHLVVVLVALTLLLRRPFMHRDLVG